MTSLIQSAARSMFAAASSDYYYSDCCPPVVDPYAWIALLAGTALVTWFLQMVIVNTMFSRKRRSLEETHVLDMIQQWSDDDDLEEDFLNSTEHFQLKSHGGTVILENLSIVFYYFQRTV